MTKDEALMQMLNEINAGLKTALTRVNELVAENKALKEALAQPAQEPESECNPQDLCAGCRCKYVAQPAQEPAYNVTSNGRHSPLLTHMMNKRADSNINQVIHLYDQPTPPKRPWVGLTDDEHCDIWYKESLDWMEYGKAIEAKLKQKNGYAEEKNT